MPRIPLRLAAPALLLSGACIPYATGTTAAPTPRGEVVPSLSVYFIPGGAENLVDSAGGSLIGIDAEVRTGLTAESDLGVRVPGASGLVVTWKRRLRPLPDPAAPSTAVMLGAGVVNAGDHAHLEASLLWSGRQAEELTPYAGVKVMQVIPMHPQAVSDAPTVGAFAGLRIGRETLGISPEIAVFHDRSALGLRDRAWIVVPSFTFHGDRLLNALRGRDPGRRPPGPLPPPRPWP